MFLFVEFSNFLYHTIFAILASIKFKFFDLFEFALYLTNWHFLTEIPIFTLIYQNFDVNLIFCQNVDFSSKFHFFTIISIFDQNFVFWLKFRFLTKISIFWQNNLCPTNIYFDLVKRFLSKFFFWICPKHFKPKMRNFKYLTT